MRQAPGEPGFLMALRSALDGYVRTAITGASESEIAELRGLMLVRVDIIEETGRPGSRVFGTDESNGHAADLLEPALDHLTRRKPTTAQLCSGVGSWAGAFAQIATEHTIPPVARLGAIVWLVRVALSSVERAALKKAPTKKAAARTARERLAAIGVVVDFAVRNRGGR
jgi:hypothetical protein